MIAVALAVMIQAGAPTAAPRAGVAAGDPGRFCVALSGTAPAQGTTVTLVEPARPLAPQRIFHGRIGKAVASCAAMDRQQLGTSIYELTVDIAPEVPVLAIALLGDVTPSRIHARSCASAEGLHLTLWSGAPLHSTRVWHEYWYLGYDVEPDCAPADYAPDRSRN